MRIYQEKSAGEKAVVDSFRQLKATDLGGDPYDSSEDDSLFLVAPGVTKEDNYGCVHMLARAWVLMCVWRALGCLCVVCFERMLLSSCQRVVAVVTNFSSVARACVLSRAVSLALSASFSFTPHF